MCGEQKRAGRVACRQAKVGEALNVLTTATSGNGAIEWMQSFRPEILSRRILEMFGRIFHAHCQIKLGLCALCMCELVELLATRLLFYYAHADTLIS